MAKSKLKRCPKCGSQLSQRKRSFRVTTGSEYASILGDESAKEYQCKACGYSTRNVSAEEIIWGFLLDHAGEKFYLTQISRETGISDSTASQILEKQVKKGLARKEKLGNLSIYSVDPSDPVIKLKKEEKTYSVIRPLINELKGWSQKIILYGSSASGENTIQSDVDLFVLSNEKDQIYKIFSRSKIKNRTRLLVKNFLEWVEMKEKDKFFVSQINKGKVLWDQNEKI